ncbi:MAG: oxygenase MpaB family protein [Terracidiphilus sp.]
MEPDVNQNPAAQVTEQGSEALLMRVARLAAGPETGIFGPESLIWRINRESALFLGAGRAALLQLAHPWVAAALAEHSTLLDRPIARFHNTFRVVFTMVFGTLEQALAAGRHLYTLHTRITGHMPENVAGYRRGSSYVANEVAALRWVFATLVESAVIAYEAVLPPLGAREREQYYAEACTLAGLFGIPPEALPENWEAFAAYNREMWASNALGVSQGAHALARSLLAGAGSWIHPPPWYRALTAAWMPPRFREELGLGFGAPERRSAERALRLLPRIYSRLPGAMRFNGPWREAQARLARRRPGRLTQWSNRFWIGQPRMPFGSAVRTDGRREPAIVK